MGLEFSSESREISFAATSKDYRRGLFYLFATHHPDINKVVDWLELKLATVAEDLKDRKNVHQRDYYERDHHQSGKAFVAWMKRTERHFERQQDFIDESRTALPELRADVYDYDSIAKVIEIFSRLFALHEWRTDDRILMDIP